MNKGELISAIADKVGITKVDTEIFLNAFTAVVQEGLKRDDKISLVGFGMFYASKRKATNGINPRTLEKIQIPASVLPKFRAGKSFKDALN